MSAPLRGLHLSSVEPPAAEVAPVFEDTCLGPGEAVATRLWLAQAGRVSAKDPEKIKQLHTTILGATMHNLDHPLAPFFKPDSGG